MRHFTTILTSLNETVNREEMVSVSGRNTMRCTFEGRERDCILSSDLVNVRDTWLEGDGNGFVADNTINNGQ